MKKTMIATGLIASFSTLSLIAQDSPIPSEKGGIVDFGPIDEGTNFGDFEGDNNSDPRPNNSFPNFNTSDPVYQELSECFSARVGNLSQDINVNFRFEPSLSAGVISAIPDFSPVEVFELVAGDYVFDTDLGIGSDIWVNIFYEGTEGYVHGLYLNCDDDFVDPVNPVDPNDPVDIIIGPADPQPEVFTAAIPSGVTVLGSVLTCTSVVVLGDAGMDIPIFNWTELSSNVLTTVRGNSPVNIITHEPGEGVFMPFSGVASNIWYLVIENGSIGFIPSAALSCR